MSALIENLPVLSLALAAGVAYCFLVLRRPIIGLFAVVTIFFLPIKLGGVTVLQAVGVITAGLVIAWYLRQRRTMVLSNIFIPLVLLGALIVISLPYTHNLPLTVYYVRKWMFNMLFFLLLVNIVTDLRGIKWVTWAFAAAAAANAAAGVLDFAASTDQFHRAGGLLPNQNGLGIICTLGFPLLFYHYLYGRGAMRWIWLALCGLPVAGLVVSVSRGSFLALLVVLAFILVVEKKRRALTALALVIGLAALPFMPSYWTERIGTLGEALQKTVPVGQGKELTPRGIYNKAGIEMWKSHPVVGVGIGNFGHYLVDLDINPGVSKTSTPKHTVAHNIYIQVLAEFGTAGFIVLLWLILGTARNLILARRTCRDDEKLWPYLGAIEGMAIVYLVTSASSGNLLGQGLWAVLGLAATSGQLAKRYAEQRETAGAPREQTPGAALLGPRDGGDAPAPAG